MSTEDNKALVRRFHAEIWSQGNLTVVDELCAPNFIYHTPSGPIQGLEGFKQYVTMYRTAFPDLYIPIDDMIAEADKVVTRWTARGTHKGDLMGIPPTGKQVTIPGILIGRFEGGKFVEGWIEFDALGMMQQLGVIPAPEQAS
jgi:steroid delta-isomerase-like uncharacterized protein